MKKLILILCLFPLGCPVAPGDDGVKAGGTADDGGTARQRLLKALEESDRSTLTRAEVAKAWRAPSDDEWESWDRNDDDVLDRGEIGSMDR